MGVYTNLDSWILIMKKQWDDRNETEKCEKKREREKNTIAFTQTHNMMNCLKVYKTKT